MKRPNNFSRMRTTLALFCISFCIMAFAGFSQAAKYSYDKPPAPVETTGEKETTPKNYDGDGSSEYGALEVDPDPLRTKVPGVGSSFAKLLDQLIFLTGGTKNKFQEIFEKYPIMLPDLYRVFIKL
ncbi:MAG: hypothetical protein D6B25_01080 [Desulfobulbaceae bacterium]|nr:MAG: hypothetical protein D6B25_01080 [Desulfobulbaceae bacterium]